jgi:TPR repeat protein
MKKITSILIVVSILSSTVFGDDITDAGIAFDNKEYIKAFKLYNLVCDNGNAFGCTMVGAFFEDGLSIQTNLNEALAYYAKACDMGHEYSCESHTKLQAKLPNC